MTVPLFYGARQENSKLEPALPLLLPLPFALRRGLRI
jgi:hypothetical protein